MPPRNGLGKRLTEQFFSKAHKNSDIYTCQCGVRRKRTGTNYQNLISHVQAPHPDYFEKLCAGNDLDQSKMKNYFLTAKSSHIYGWIDFIVSGLLPFSFVEKHSIRKHIRHEDININTFMKYISGLTRAVEEKIATLLPEKIALVFDGWSSDSTHYLAVFATFPSANERVFSQRLLTMSPMGDETTLSASEHYEFLSYLLGLYRLS